MYPSVVVGYDGTKEGERALRWAVHDARIRRCELVVHHCWRWPYPIGHSDPDLEGVVRRMGRHVLENGVALARELAPTLRVHERLSAGPVYAALMHESYEAELIVIGSHPPGSGSIGSTVLQLPGRALVPVVVVRRAAPEHRRIVVGVDGSAGSESALAFAFEEAALRGWPVEAVYGCWEPSAAAGSDLALYADEDELARSCGATLQRAVAAWRQKYPRVEVDTSLVMEGPRTALLEAAERADLIVVGDRGTGTVGPLVLGSTSTALLQHSPCTVAVAHSVK